MCAHIPNMSCVLQKTQHDVSCQVTSETVETVAQYQQYKCGTQILKMLTHLTSPVRKHLFLFGGAVRDLILHKANVKKHMTRCACPAGICCDRLTVSKICVTPKDYDWLIQPGGLLPKAVDVVTATVTYLASLYGSLNVQMHHSDVDRSRYPNMNVELWRIRVTLGNVRVLLDLVSPLHDLSATLDMDVNGLTMNSDGAIGLVPWHSSGQLTGLDASRTIEDIQAHIRDQRCYLLIGIDDLLQSPVLRLRVWEMLERGWCIFLSYPIGRVQICKTHHVYAAKWHDNVDLADRVSDGNAESDLKHLLTVIESDSSSSSSFSSLCHGL